MPPRHSAGFSYCLFRTRGSALRAVPRATIYRPAITGLRARLASLPSSRLKALRRGRHIKHRDKFPFVGQSIYQRSPTKTPYLQKRGMGLFGELTTALFLQFAALLATCCADELCASCFIKFKSAIQRGSTFIVFFIYIYTGLSQ